MNTHTDKRWTNRFLTKSLQRQNLLKTENDGLMLYWQVMNCKEETDRQKIHVLLPKIVYVAWFDQVCYISGIALYVLKNETSSLINKKIT